MTKDYIEPDPVIEFYKKDIDRTLLRRNLKLTVAERLANLVEMQRLAEAARRAGEQADQKEEREEEH
jgi:hypothetical protein